MLPPNKSFRTILALAVVYAAVVLFPRKEIKGVRITTDKKAYLHYELVGIKVETRERELLARWKKSPPIVVVTRNGQEVRTIAGVRRFATSPSGSAFPIPWNAAPAISGASCNA